MLPVPSPPVMKLFRPEFPEDMVSGQLTTQTGRFSSGEGFRRWSEPSTSAACGGVTGWDSGVGAKIPSRSIGLSSSRQFRAKLGSVDVLWSAKGIIVGA